MAFRGSVGLGLELKTNIFISMIDRYIKLWIENWKKKGKPKYDVRYFINKKKILTYVYIYNILSQVFLLASFLLFYFFPLSFFKASPLGVWLIFSNNIIFLYDAVSPKKQSFGIYSILKITSIYRWYIIKKVHQHISKPWFLVYAFACPVETVYINKRHLLASGKHLSPSFFLLSNKLLLLHLLSCSLFLGDKVIVEGWPLYMILA